MQESDSIRKHIGAFYKIIIDLKDINVKINDKDKLLSF